MKRYKCSNFDIVEVATSRPIPHKVLQDLLKDIDTQTKFGFVSEMPGIVLEHHEEDKHAPSICKPEESAEFKISAKVNAGEKVPLKRVGKPDKHIRLFSDGTLFLEAGYKYQIIYQICPEHAMFSVKLGGINNPCEVTSGFAGFCIEARQPVKFSLILRSECAMELSGFLVIDKISLY